jgi:hypothetical protein
MRVLGSRFSTKDLNRLKSLSNQPTQTELRRTRSVSVNEDLKFNITTHKKDKEVRRHSESRVELSRNITRTISTKNISYQDQSSSEKCIIKQKKQVTFKTGRDFITIINIPQSKNLHFNGEKSEKEKSVSCKCIIF